MNDSADPFGPWSSVIEGLAHQDCCACITIPVRNEAEDLSRCLNALAAQVDLDGVPLQWSSYEVLLLLNNCTDASMGVAQAWRETHPLSMPLYIAECTTLPEQAHVGTARRMLMDTAWHRLQRSAATVTAILSTDADTVVATDWVAQNLLALQAADVVGGNVHLLPEHLAALPRFVRRCYERDREYAELIAQLEDVLDPQENDRWPRHLDHFGSSLACTPAAYAQAGGLPAVTPLEDEAFVDRVRHAGLRLRHAPDVRVYTSARMHGRAGMGLAGQLRLWSRLPDREAHLVRSAAFLDFRFRFMRRLREIFDSKYLGDLQLPTDWWRDTFANALGEQTTCPGFLGAVYCDILIAESFSDAQEEDIDRAILGLRTRLAGAPVVMNRQIAAPALGGRAAEQASYSVDVLAAPAQ